MTKGERDTIWYWLACYQERLTASHAAYHSWATECNRVRSKRRPEKIARYRAMMEREEAGLLEFLARGVPEGLGEFLVTYP